MYTPESFRITIPELAHGIMHKQSFATLVTPVVGRPPSITHLPLVFDARGGGEGVLRGHVARANPHWQDFANGDPSVVIFQGPHAYVSPRWYATNVAVPTWNYVVIHAHGRPEIIEDPRAVRGHLEELVERHEAGPRPWRISDLSAELYQKLASGIVCFSMAITAWEGKAKLGQNRSPEDQAGLLAGLEAEESPAARDLAEITKAFQLSGRS